MTTDAKQLLDQNIAQAISNMAKAIGQAVVDGRRTCLTCLHFKEHEGESCALAGQRPPARVIAFGCSAHMEDDIPF